MLLKHLICYDFSRQAILKTPVFIWIVVGDESLTHTVMNELLSQLFLYGKKLLIFIICAFLTPTEKYFDMMWLCTAAFLEHLMLQNIMNIIKNNKN